MCRLLPTPLHAPVVSDDEDDIGTQTVVAESSTAVVTRMARPPYGQRNGWKPTSQEDYGVFSLFYSRLSRLIYHSGNGGSYPECHVAQYPLGMGKKKVGWLKCFVCLYC